MPSLGNGSLALPPSLLTNALQSIGTAIALYAATFCCPSWTSSQILWCTHQAATRTLGYNLFALPVPAPLQSSPDFVPLRRVSSKSVLSTDLVLSSHSMLSRVHLTRHFLIRFSCRLTPDLSSVCRALTIAVYLA